MHYVYILKSLSSPDKYYVGETSDLKKRFNNHNSGNSVHTNKYLPWEIDNYFAFSNKNKALEFEKYLKTSSGRSFCKRHF